MMIREIIKKSIPEQARYFLRLDNYRDLFFYASVLFKRLLCHCLSFSFRYPLKQVINTISVELNLLKKNDFNITSSFRESGFSFQEGRHCVYLSDQDDLARILGDVLSNYPQPVGLKIVKSKEISPDGTPFYTSARNAPASNCITMRAVGSLLEKVIISNILSLSDFAPRVYDIICFKIAECQFFGLIVQHIDGDQVTGKAGLDFIDLFREILKKENITIVAVKRNKDFQPPDFNHNIYSYLGGTVYIDIQNFAFLKKKERTYPAQLLKRFDIGVDQTATRKILDRCLSFRDQRKIKRKLVKFAETFELFFSERKLDLGGLIVVDMGVPLGLYTSLALSFGASLSYILRPNEEEEIVKRYLFESGFSRFQFSSVSGQGDFEEISQELDLLFFHINYGFDLLLQLVQANHLQNLLLDFYDVEISESRKDKMIQQLSEIGYFCSGFSLPIGEDVDMILFSKGSSLL